MARRAVEVARAERYRALAGATGGSFLSVRQFDSASPEARTFLDAVAGDADGAARRARQRRYELEAEAGRTERLGWYKALPPS